MHVFANQVTLPPDVAFVMSLMYIKIRWDQEEFLVIPHTGSHTDHLLFDQFLPFVSFQKTKNI